MQIRRVSVAFAATALAAAGLVATSLAQAHGIWFAQRARLTALIYGVGADDLDMVKRQPLVTAVKGYDEDGAEVPTNLQVAGPLLVADSETPPSVVTAVLFNGTWSKKPSGEWVKQGRDEVPDALVSEKNYKYAVAIVGPMSKPLGPLPDQRLQILPVDAIPALLDQPMKIRVLFDGKPVAGVSVLRDYVNDPDAKAQLTDRDGTVTIRVRNQGHNVIAAIYKSPPDDPKKVDHLEHLATLSLTLPHLPE